MAYKRISERAPREDDRRDKENVILPVARKPRKGLARSAFFLFLLLFFGCCVWLLTKQCVEEIKASEGKVGRFFVEQGIGMPE